MSAPAHQRVQRDVAIIGSLGALAIAFAFTMSLQPFPQGGPNSSGRDSDGDWIWHTQDDS
jgi:hypothetical protein